MEGSSSSPSKYPGSRARGMTYRHEFSGVASVRATHAVAYMAVPSGRKVAGESSGCLSLCGENAVCSSSPRSSYGSTCQQSASKLSLLPVARSTTSESSCAMDHASSYMSRKLGFHPWRMSWTHASASSRCATLFHGRHAAGILVYPSRRIRSRASSATSSSAAPTIGRTEAWNASSQTCSDGQSSRQYPGWSTRARPTSRACHDVSWIGSLGEGSGGSLISTAGVCTMRPAKLTREICRRRRRVFRHRFRG